MLRPGALGDTLLAVPALRLLRAHFGQVSLAAHLGAARLLAALGEVEHGIAFDDPSLGWIFRGEPAGQPVVAWMSAPVTGAWLVAPGRPPAAAAHAGEPPHCAAYLLASLAPLGIRAPALPSLASRGVPPAAEAPMGDGDTPALDAPLRVRPLPSDEVLVHPGSGAQAKNWPADRFAAVVDALDVPVRLVVGEADAEPAARLEAALGRRLAWLEHPSLSELAARLAGCRAYLGNDSGVSHLAGLCGARSVVLFGPTDPRIWRPLGPRVHVERFEATPAAVARALLPD